jgi:pyruvate/2-oxoglutarate dehydrogenase complex dihydrolipoamide acyltransferase (E2) component
VSVVIEIRVPALGENIDEAMFSAWSRKIGDYVEQGDVLFQVESDKATVDVEAPAAGYLLKTLVEQGEAVTVGQVLGYLGEKGEVT